MTTPVLGLTELSNTSGERSTIIDTVRVLDAMWGKVVSANININTPPTSPVDGTSVLISSAPTGSFSGFAGHLAIYIGTGWQFVSPDNIGFVQTDTGPYEPNGTLDGWVPLTLPAGSPLTTKGDLLTYSTGDVRLAVGADGQVLVANSATPTGLEWVTQTLGGSALTLENNGNPLSTNVTKLNFTNFTITEPNPDEFNITVPNSNGGGRTTLTSATTFYVRADGNDANDGLTNNAAGAFLTIQKAVDVAASLDISIYDVVIKIAQAGTYDLGAGTLTLKEPVGSGRVTIEGASSTASDTIITNNGSNPSIVKNDGRGLYRLKNLQILVPGTATGGNLAISNAYLEIENLWVKRVSAASSSEALVALNNSVLRAISSYTIEGAFGYPLNIGLNSLFDALGVNVVTVGNPTWGLCYALGRMGSYYNFQNATFTGTASGDRANLAQGSFLRHNIGVTLPGSTNGPVDSTSFFGLV